MLFCLKMFKKFFLYPIIFFSVSFCTSQNYSFKKWEYINYPYWFVYPKDKHQLVTGYSGKYYYISTSIENAKKDALKNFSKFSECIIQGKQIYIYTSSGCSLTDDSLFINIEEKELKDFVKEFTFIDTFICNDFIALGYSTKQFSPEEKRRVKMRKNCHWKSEIPSSNNYLYSVGMSDGFFNEKRSWNQAENNAILNLARSISLKNKVTELRANGIQMGKIEQEVSIFLRNIQLVERWKDEDNNLFYVLIRIRKGNYRISNIE